MYYAYILKSERDGTFYTGYTQDIEKRLWEHNNGKSEYTSHHMPWKLVHYEAFINQKDALSREKYFKTYEGGQERNKLLNNYLTHNDETGGTVRGSRKWKLKNKIINIVVEVVCLIIALYLLLYVLPRYSNSIATFFGNQLFK